MMCVYILINTYYACVTCTILALLQNYGIFKIKESQKTCPLQLTVPEVKIFLIFFYLLVLMSISWISATVMTNDFPNVAFSLVRHVQCMSGGDRQGLDCGEFRRQLEANSHPELALTYLPLYAFLNLSSLPFVIKYRTIKKMASPPTRATS